MNRRAFTTAVSSTAVLLATGCNSGPKKRAIGVVAKGRAHLFWQSVQAGAMKAGLEKDVEIVWNAPASETDISTQIQIVDSMIARRVDAIALAPIDKGALVQVVERAAKANIPMVIFDSGVDTENYLSMVATDNYLGGAVAAERMGEMLSGKGKIAIVGVQPGAASTIAREQGFQDTIKSKFPGIAIADLRYGYADFAKSLAAAENMLTAYPDLVAMFGSNESATVGIAQALKGRKTSVKLIGFDWTPNLKEDLIAGRIDSLVVQDPFRMGFDSVTIALDKLDGKSVNKNNAIKPVLIKKEDLARPEIDALLNPDLKKYLKS
jgi:ribose transport system substrate-binding protein